MEATGERFIPGAASWLTTGDHLSRYRACTEMARGRKVLDAACGSGYGTEILSQTANRVTGIDIDPEAVDWAAANHSSTNTEFVTASVAELPFVDSSFDLIVSFETLEHIPEDLQLKFIDESARVLAEDGVLVISTPDRLLTEERGTDNPFHVRELSEPEFRALLGRRYAHVAIYYQNMWAYNEILPADDESEVRLVTTSDTKLRGQNLIAVCSNAPQLPALGCVRRTETGLWDLQADIDARVAAVHREAARTVAGYEGSVSWRITSPLRAVRRLFK